MSAVLKPEDRHPINGWLVNALFDGGLEVNVDVQSGREAGEVVAMMMHNRPRALSVIGIDRHEIARAVGHSMLEVPGGYIAIASSLTSEAGAGREVNIVTSGGYICREPGGGDISLRIERTSLMMAVHETLSDLP
jgi:hypothetical protein